MVIIELLECFIQPPEFYFPSKTTSQITFRHMFADTKITISIKCHYQRKLVCLWRFQIIVRPDHKYDSVQGGLSSVFFISSYYCIVMFLLPLTLFKHSGIKKERKNQEGKTERIPNWSLWRRRRVSNKYLAFIWWSHFIYIILSSFLQLAYEIHKYNL